MLIRETPVWYLRRTVDWQAAKQAGWWSVIQFVTD